MAPIVSFFGVFLIAMVNVVATELEEPFMDDANGASRPSLLACVGRQLTIAARCAVQTFLS